MRVCLVYDCLYPWTVGGGERWLRSLAEALAAEGHDVTYLTRLQWDLDDPPDLPGVDVVAVSRREPLYGPDGNRTVGEPLRFGRGVLGHLLRHGDRYDVVHTAAFPYFSLLAAGLARRRGRYSLVAEWYEVWSDAYWREYVGGPRALVATAIQRACARIPQRAFCLSDLHARRLVELGLDPPPEKLRGLYAGSLGRPDPAPARDEVVFAGRLIAEKRAAAIVPAVLEAAKAIPGLRGTIFGAGPQLDEVRATIAALGAQDTVRAPGFVSREEIDDGQRHALCLLLPSSREGYGLVAVESFANGVPVVLVAGEDNAATELVEEGVNGFVAPDASPEALAAAIRRVHAGGQALRESTADWFADHAAELSLEASLRQVLGAYRSATARS